MGANVAGGQSTHALTAAQLQARLSAAALDATTVRGRTLPTDLFRFDLAPQFLPPPLYAETQSIALFGV